ncbi:MAG: EAL domain-containing protein [Actinobacteria bacterium]|nr:EAL domain-containing protein [Actinomycetota bacterium]MSY78348.1 EAL domain-containing protein [Actinomycetota bacterium]
MSVEWSSELPLTAEPRDASAGASPQVFLDLLGATGDVIVLLNEDLSVRWVSASVEKFGGWTAEQAASMDPSTLLHPREIKVAMTNLERLLQGASPESCRTDVRLRKSSGDWIWSEVTGVDLRQLDGVNAIVLSIRDTSDRVDRESDLADQANRFEALVRNSNDCIMVSNKDLVVTYASSAMFRILGFEPSLAIGLKLGASVREPHLTRLHEACAQVILHPNEAVRVEVELRHADGRLRLVENVLTNCLDDPLVRGIVTNFRDVTDQRLALEDLQERTAQVEAAEAESRRLLDIFDVTPDLTVLSDAQGAAVYLNAAARKFFGLARPELDLMNTEQLVGFSNWLGPLNEQVLQALTQEGSWVGELEIRRHDGVMVPVSVQMVAHYRPGSTEVDFYSGVARDISERKDLQASLQIQATHDQLTGLPNRVLLFEKIERAMAGLKAAPLPSRSALLFIDIDHFKKFNDTLGHAKGDVVLQQVARRICEVVRPGDTVARFGGDEFIVLCERLDTASDAVVIAHRINAACLLPLEVEGSSVAVGVSIGIAQIDPSEADPLAVIRDADAAMYEAKAGGRGRWVIFDDKMGAKATQRRRVESWMRNTLQGEEFSLHYQPVVSLVTGELTGVEALLRWKHGESSISPDVFVPIAEESGLIVPIGEWVLRTACQQLAAWQQLPGWAGLRLAVNVSGRQLQDPGFNLLAVEALSQSGLTPNTLSVEITETVLLDDAAAWGERLAPLKELGIEISLDDFGTGHSSLTYLRRFPADTVKLDQSFVSGIEHNLEDRAIVSAVIDLCSTLGLTCVAEGVETFAQLELLKGLGCAAGQGHLFAPGLEPLEFEAQFLAESGPGRADT